MRRAREAIRAARRRRARPTCSRACLLALYGIVPWRACRKCRWRSCCCRDGFPSISTRFPIGPHGDRAASGADGEKAARAQRERRRASTNCSSNRRSARADAEGAASEGVVVLVLPRRRQCAARGRAAVSQAHTRQRAIDRAVAWVTERLNGEDGLGAIFPAMANSVMMYRRARLSGGPSAARHRAPIDREASGRARRRGLLPALRVADLGYRACLPCAVGGRRRARRGAASRGLDWLVPLQVLDVKGDWVARRPDLRPGGWAFQYANPHYPDLDDTAVVVMAMDRCRADACRPPRGLSTPRSRARANGSSACRAATAAGARSTPTTTIIISTIFPSPITARCSIRRPRTSRRAACRCWRNWRDHGTARR